MVYKATLSEDQLEIELKKALQDLRQHLVESKKVRSAETLMRFGLFSQMKPMNRHIVIRQALEESL